MIPTIMKMHLLQMLQGQVDVPQMVSLYSPALRKRGQSVRINTDLIWQLHHSTPFGLELIQFLCVYS